MKRKPDDRSKSKSPSKNKRKKNISSSPLYWSGNEEERYRIRTLSPIENFYASHSESPDLEQIIFPWISNINQIVLWDESHIRKAFNYLLNHKYKKYKFIKKIFGNDETVDIFEINTDGTIKNNLYDNYFKISEYMTQRSKIKLIIAPFRIVFKEEDEDHANLLIINKVNSTVELYDPHGSINYFTDWKQYNIKKRIEDYLVSLYPNIFNLYTFLSYSDICPLKGFQYIDDSFAKKNQKIDKVGYCINWSLFMLDLRLKYYKYDPKYIQQLMINQTRIFSNNNDKTLAKNFLNFIRKYTYYIDKYKITNKSKSTSSIDDAVLPDSLFNLEIEGDNN